MRVIQAGGKDNGVVAVWSEKRPAATLHEVFRITTYKPGMPFIFVDYLSTVMTGTCRTGP